MDIFALLWIVSLAFTGLTEGAGVLPDGLNAAVGGKVMFTTTLTPGTSFQIVLWKCGSKDIFTFYESNLTSPEYEGRITFFRSTGSLELRNLALTDSGGYSVTILIPGERPQSGITRLNVKEPVSNVMITSSSTELVEFNSSVSLSCSSSGSSLSFLWLNSSSEVTGSDRVQITDGGSTLTIVNVTRYDQGPFSCRVSNPASEGTSAPVALTIYYGPEDIILTISPTKEHHQEGSDISLSCSADSGPPAQFKWFLNESLLSDGPELQLMNVQISQSGSYSCQAFNDKTLRYEISPPASISVLEKVSGASVTSPSNLPIEGNSFRLICDAAGSVFTREWRKGGLDLTLTVNMTLTNNNRELSFSSLNKDDTGDYSCIISNPFGSEEAKYSMIVNYGPETAQITGPSQIHVGDTFKLTCSAASEPPAKYTWMLQWTEIHTSAVFYKNNTELSHSGNYSCEAMNDITGRKSSAVHELTVTHEPEPEPEPVSNVMVTSSSTELVEFSSVSLSCSSSGSSLSFLWLNSSSEVTGSDRVQITDGGSTLTIISMTRYDQGPFSCRVSNPISEGTSAQLTLTIYYGPDISDKRTPSGRIRHDHSAVESVYVTRLAYSARLLARKPNKKLSAGNTNTRTGVEGQDNGAYPRSQEMHYADVRFSKKNNGGTVQMRDQNKPLDYAEVRVNNNPRAAASSLPTYDAPLQRNRKPAPQPENAELYAQVRKN